MIVRDVLRHGDRTASVCEVRGVTPGVMSSRRLPAVLTGKVERICVRRSAG
jgi:hypothetical protein